MAQEIKNETYEENMKIITNLIKIALIAIIALCGENLLSQNYPIVGTGVSSCYNNTTTIPCPSNPTDPFFGQFQGKNTPSFKNNGDGTITDLVTELMWQSSPDANGNNNGTIEKADKLTWAQIQAKIIAINNSKYAGYNDWRIPSIKELYSLINWNGTDPSGLQGNSTTGLSPFIDRNYFPFAWGDVNSGERLIDVQYASSNMYKELSWNGSQQLFGFNFADGRIKGYDLKMPDGSEKVFSFIAVRGNSNYGINDFIDNGNNTISDKATGLMWSKDDSQTGMNWEQALAYAQSKNKENFCGYNDWRLPNAKELQSILDYSRSPGTTNSAAINPIFNCSSITNEAGNKDYPWFWTSTTHMSFNGTSYGGSWAIYVCFGRATGWMRTPPNSYFSYIDVHGAGAQRSAPKSGTYLGDYLGVDINGKSVYGKGPQGDVIRVNNYVRLVRDISSSSGSLPDVPKIKVTGDTVFCNGDSVLLSVDSQKDCNYQWMNGKTNVGTNSPSYVVYNPGIYTIQISNKNGSVLSSNSIKVSVNNKPSVTSVIANGPITFCDGDSVRLTCPTQEIVNYQWKKDNIKTGNNTNNLMVYQSGLYTLELSNDCGITQASNSISVKVNPIPSIPSIIQVADDTLSCSYDADKYIWYLNGVKTNFNNKKIKIIENGNYTVKVIMSDCESKESLSFQVTSLDVESEQKISNDIQIYPNPASDFVNISGINTAAKILDYMGQEVISLESINSKTIDISTLVPGIYFVRMGIKVSKFIKN